MSEALEAGAIGVSTGLFYEPANAAPTEEVIEICRPLRSSHGALLHAHARRGRPCHRLAGRRPSASAANSACRWWSRTHKVVGEANHGRSAETLSFIERAHGHAVDLPGLLSVLAPSHRALGRSRGELDAHDRELVEASARVRGTGPGRHRAEDGRVGGRGHRSACFPRAESTSAGRGRRAAHPAPSSTRHDRLRRAAARRSPASTPVGNLPARAGPLRPGAGALPARDGGAQDDRAHGDAISASRIAAC